jgi:hypothetical protein
MFAYMRKEDGGKIQRVPLNKWPGYRRSGWVFCSELDWQNQQAARTPAEVEAETVETASKKKKKKKKVMRRT